MEVGGKEGTSFQSRKAELEAEKKKAEEAAEREKKNRGFTQTYPAGWARIRELLDTSPAAAKLYTLLAEHMGNNGAVVASQETLAEHLGCTDRTIRNLTKILHEAKAITRIRIGSGTYAYCLRPEEVWKSWATMKEGAAFNTAALIGKRAAREGHANLTHMLLTSGKLTAEENPKQEEFDLETGEIKNAA